MPILLFNYWLFIKVHICTLPSNHKPGWDSVSQNSFELHLSASSLVQTIAVNLRQGAGANHRVIIHFLCFEFQPFLNFCTSCINFMNTSNNTPRPEDLQLSYSYEPEKLVHGQVNEHCNPIKVIIKIWGILGVNMMIWWKKYFKINLCVL